MTSITSSQSLFLTVGGGGSGGGGGGDGSVTVVNNLTSTSTTSALSAKMGNELSKLLNLHKGTVATELEYGHVKIDNDTIKVNSDGQIYVDFGTGDLKKVEFTWEPTSVGQTEFEFTYVGYKPEEYVDLLFNNSIKIHAMSYTVEVVNEKTFTYKVVLKNPVVNIDDVYNLVLLFNDSKSIKSRLTKIEYVMNPDPINPSIIDIPFSSYNPDTFVDLIFNNTTKVHGDEYQILPKDQLDLTKGYYINLSEAPINPSQAFFNLVFITNGLTSGGGYVDVSRFYEGSNPPVDTSLIWYKTS